MLAQHKHPESSYAIIRNSALAHSINHAYEP